MPTDLIRVGKDPFTPVSAEACLVQDVWNSNVGNFLFAHSVYRSLSTPDTDLVPNNTIELERATDADRARVNERFDRFVIPLANAFRPGFRRRLDNLASMIEGLDIPVVVIGVGAQAGFALDDSELGSIDDTVKRFVSAVLDRSASIGVRGEFTADYLRRLGFCDDAVDVIGCPSFFLHGRDHRVRPVGDPLTDTSAVTVNLTPDVPAASRLCEQAMSRFANLTYVGQTAADLALLLWGRPGTNARDHAYPARMSHPLYRSGDMRTYLDVWPWMDFLARQDFTLGTRLHGNAAALMAGAPSLLLTHDSRTRELAELHALPHVPAGTLGDRLDFDALHERTDVEPFNRELPRLFDHYVRFLEHNGLEHVHHGDLDPAVDQRLQDTHFPAPVRPLTAEDTEGIASRLQWLYEGIRFDASTHSGAYPLPYPHPARRDDGELERRRNREADRQLRRIRAKLKDATSRLQESEQALAGAHERLERQHRRVAELEARASAHEQRLTELEESSGGLVARLRGRRS